MAFPNDKTIPVIEGNHPGLLDPSQLSRLLRSVTSHLVFATFDENTANAKTDICDLHTVHPNSVGTEKDGSSRLRHRIVIETDAATWRCTWRFVPPAKTDPELKGDEGTWPRLVDFCGRVVHMSQDQWDLHKLDAEYECYVTAAPNITTIRRKKFTMPTTPAPSSPVQPSITPSTANKAETMPTNQPKRRPSHVMHKTPRGPDQSNEHTTPPAACPSVAMADPDDDQDAIKRQPPCATQETPREPEVSTPKQTGKRPMPTTCPSIAMADPNEDEDADVIMVDEELPSTSSPGCIPKGIKRTLSMRQRHSYAFFTDNQGAPGSGFSSQSSPLNNQQAGNATGSLDSLDSPDSYKRTRIHSPASVRRHLHQKKVDRIRKKKAQLQARFFARKEFIERAFWEQHGIPAYAQETYFNHRASNTTATASERNGVGSSAPPSETEQLDVDDEAAREARIAESRRKLAELEKDRPLWEESKRKREAQERADELRRRQEKAKRETQEREQQRWEERKKPLDGEQQRERTAQERKMLQKQKSREMFVRSDQGKTGWNTNHAYLRYLRTSEVFDKATFENDLVTFASIPWPILFPVFSVQDIEWANVEKFFFTYSRQMNPEDFKKLVVLSQRRFHPDKWRARKVLHGVKDDLERDLLEIAGNLVSQAISPFWEQIRSQ